MQGKKLAIIFGIVGATIVVGSLLFFVDTLLAATNISSNPNDHWAWNDLIGWMNFFGTDSVIVSGQKLSGYASSSIGEISLDCATSPLGDVCLSKSNYEVKNDGGGNLSGWGWNDTYGWISFCGTTNAGAANADCPLTGSDYRVLIHPTTGVFTQWAWNDVAGWVSFNCTNHGGCAPAYRVVASWQATSSVAVLDSSIFDTQVAGGAQLNSIIWYGNLPADTKVKFQFAGSNNPAGPWDYKGPDGSSDSHYEPIGQAIPLKLDYTLHNNHRYFRYRITLVSNQAQTEGPRVDDVVINWSP